MENKNKITSRKYYLEQNCNKLLPIYFKTLTRLYLIKKLNSERRNKEINFIGKPKDFSIKLKTKIKKL